MNFSSGEIVLLLAVLALAVIPLALYVAISMTKKCNDTIRRCDEILEWADKRLKELEVDVEEIEQEDTE